MRAVIPIHLQGSPTPMNPPYVTLIMPVQNESAFILRGLTAITMQDYPAERMEIFVADGMSTDDTRAIVEGFAALHPRWKIKIVENRRRIVSTGLNAALRCSQGDIIIRVDGHTVIAPDYVSQCVQNLQHAGADNVGGRMDSASKNIFGEAVSLATSVPFGAGGARFRCSDKEEWVDTVYMGAWPRRVFEKIGLFDEELARDQDDEFNYRLRAAGGRILLSPRIKSEYITRSSPLALWRQYYEYGFWKVRVMQKHPHQMSLRQFVPPAFALALFVSFASSFYPALRLASLVIPLLYLVANLCASAWVAFKRGWKSAPLLPLVFAILHVSYGLGFWVGMFKFWNRWGDKTGDVPLGLEETVG